MIITKIGLIISQISPIRLKNRGGIASVRGISDNGVMAIALKGHPIIKLARSNIFSYYLEMKIAREVADER